MHTDPSAMMSHVHCVHKKQSWRTFSIIFFRTDETLQNLEVLFSCLLRIQLQLHFQQMLC